MPQINRIRIINFSYNSNNRHIIDETFDFYQGENALLNLTNGGGKSVLVQLLLQPIIPNTKLMSRRIEDFFKGKKTPSYILIEWKLEDKGGYLLTGIALANRETQVREQDDANNSLKYFTFTSNYRESNLFDIENIPLLKKVNEKIYIEDFKEARKLISAKEKDQNLQVKLFMDEDGIEYRKHLESFNIIQDEWKSIILKINESEGGVIEIFEKCKTSQQLMNDWIIKSIEKVVNKEDRDQKKLEQMLENLVEEMISNEQFIYEKEVYQEFLKKSDEYLNKLNELVKSLDKEKTLESSIVRMYYYLKCEINKMSEKIDGENDRILNSEKELKRIDLEERSKDYYDRFENAENLTKLYNEEDEKLRLFRGKINLISSEILIEQAAREYGNIKKLGQIIAGIKAEIEKIKNSSDNKEEIRNLEYSLKLAYEKILEQSKEKSSEISEKLKDLDSDILKCVNNINELDEKNNDLQNKKGSLEGEIKIFQKYEERIKKELELRYVRNLLGEIEKGFKDNYISLLDLKLVNLNNEKVNINSKIENLKEKIPQIAESIIELRESNKKNAIDYTRIKLKIEEYYSIEKSLKPIFEKYDMDFKKLFNHKENQSFLKDKISELQKIERDLDLDVRTIKENITSLKNGTLHVSKEFRELLINKDIVFETGENYLRKQSEVIRGRLVKGNPILPFAFILYEEDIAKLKEINIELNINQIIPLLSYSDINQNYTADGNMVQVLNKLQFMCLYDNKMIDSDNLDSYLKELGRKHEGAKEQLDHYRGELESAAEDMHLLKQFNFDKDYIYDLETEEEKIKDQTNSIEAEIKELVNQQASISENLNKFNSRITEVNGLLTKLDENKSKINEFIEEDEIYLQNKQLSKYCSDSLENIKKEKNNINADIKKLRDEKLKFVKYQSQVDSKIEDTSKSLQLYKNAEMGIQIHDAAENMEIRLKTFKNNITSSLESLESEYKFKQDELKEKEDTLKSYNLEESQYIDKNYDYENLNELQIKLSKLKEEEKHSDKSCRDAEGRLREAKAKLETAQAEVKKLAEAPMEPQLIKLNFDARRKEENKTISNSKNKIIEFNANISDYKNITYRIEENVDIKKYEVNAEYNIKHSVSEDYKESIKELKYLDQENKIFEKSINNFYYNIKANYKSKNIHIENIFAGLDPLIEGAQNDKNKYYYLGERILNNNESLNKLIRACEQRLSNLEKNKNDMIQHSLLHAKQVYDEVQKIAENSSIKLEGRTRPIPMLKIVMAPIGETAEENSSKMKVYIENCVSIIKNDMKEDKKTEEIRKKISKYMSTKELLNVLSDLGKMTIYAYKIDINEKNSDYKTWEQVMKENSGGERFVSFFAVLVALMSYTRISMKFEDDYQRNKDTKVLIMDNPFGPISSEHLLKPLFKIASKYNTQLICLTDLKQNSILNCFNLIYMIKIRQNVFGTNEYIQLEKQIKEDADIKKDEMLEKAVFKSEDVQQISML